MKLIKKWAGHWETKDKKYSVSVTHGRIKGLHPKYYVSGHGLQHSYASTLKEAQEIINTWESKEE